MSETQKARILNIYLRPGTLVREHATPHVPHLLDLDVVLTATLVPRRRLRVKKPRHRVDNALQPCPCLITLRFEVMGDVLDREGSLSPRLPARAPGWQSVATMRPHLEEHANGRLAGEIPSEWLQANALGQCIADYDAVWL